MKAWVVPRYESPFVLEMVELPKPEPGPGEVRIRNKAAGLAFGETLIFEGTYQKKHSLPYVPCNEWSGIIDSCGSGATRFSPGDRVMVFSVELAGGGLAEFSVTPERYVFPCPERLSFADGAVSLMNYWTAYNALTSRGGLRPGETLVVHGATGGVGSAALEIGAALGARTIATGGNDEKLSRVSADHRINHQSGSLRDRILELTGGRGADVFFDPVGDEIFEQSMRAIAPGGRILVVGFTSGRPALARTNVMLVKMISVIGVEARLAIEQTNGVGWRDYNEMVALIENGTLNPRASDIVAFESARHGFSLLLSRQHGGKVVVEI